MVLPIDGVCRNLVDDDRVSGTAHRVAEGTFDRELTARYKAEGGIVPDLTSDLAAFP